MAQGERLSKVLSKLKAAECRQRKVKRGLELSLKFEKCLRSPELFLSIKTRSGCGVKRILSYSALGKAKNTEKTMF
jgi:hypothetical protein